MSGNNKGIGCLGGLIIIIILGALLSQLENDEQKQNQSTPPKPVKQKVETKDWKSLASNLIRDYKGKIQYIEQLNSMTCWAVLSPQISYPQALEISENIGYYIRNSTGGIDGETPIVHVFVDGKHIARAIPSGLKYIGELKIEDWNPFVFNGKYRP